ncbi:MAG: hypothetical protein CMC51_03445 [Flavobacteriaceae bacterium]|nr:hypothetical protein [Flavobacteriaceae bacterium]|tara:strand:+ start:28311 stop:29498 length:1188 start_codon:yes stop_codon:yes gene_type:complete
MKKYSLNIVYLFVLLFFSFNTKAESSKENKEFKISLLSVGEGQSLADAFGHTGIRVVDKKTNNDVIFNFGIYDYNAPNFYSNFVKGRPIYKLGVQNYRAFTKNYIRENRYIIEHEINLDEKSTQKIIDLLVKNLEKPNYVYDYLRDNCSTRVADLFIEETEQQLYNSELDIITENSYRKLIHSKTNENSWGALGIDLCLGAVMDRQISLRETLFLPEKLMQYMDTLIKNDSKLITKNIIFSPQKSLSYNEKQPSPFIVNSLISLLLIFMTYFNFKNRSWNKIVDILIYFITGTLGILIIYLWFFSNHFASAQNFNFLWAFPFNLIMVYALLRKNPPNWTVNFVKLNIILIVLLFIHWVTGVQKYNITLLPIFIALLVRYTYLIIQIKKSEYEDLH